MIDPSGFPVIGFAAGLTALGGLLMAPEIRARNRASALNAIRRAQEHGLSDLLRYRRLVRHNVVALEDGALMAAWEFAARDTSTLEEVTIIKTADQVALTLGLLEPGIVTHFYAVRSPFVEYDRGRGVRSPVLETLDGLREHFFTKTEPVFATRRYFSLRWSPPAAPMQNGKSRSVGVDGAAKSQDAVVAEFNAICSRVESGFSALNMRRLGEAQRGKSELLGFLRLCISGKGSPLVLPPPGLLLNSFLAEDYRGGEFLRIGQSEVGCVELKTYPTETWPGIVEKLASLGVAHRLSVRFMPMPLEEARKKHKGVWAEFTGSANWKTGFTDTHAAKQAQQGADAYGAAADDYTRNGRVTIVVELRAATRDLLEQGERAVCAPLEEEGFIGNPQRLAVLDTFLSTLPGEGKYAVRKHPLTALNVAHVVPLHETERGRRYAESEALPPQTPAVTYALGPGNTLCRLHMNGTRDLGHAFVVGQIGAGKSVMLANLAAMAHARLPNLNVVLLDKGRSSYPLARMLGAPFYDLLAPDADGLALFSDCDEPEQAVELLLILTEMLELWDVEVTADRSRRLDKMIRDMARIPREQRSLFAFVDQLQDDQEEKMRPVLARYARLGPLGRALDCTEDSFRSGRFNVVELGRALDLYSTEPRYLVPLLHALMWRLQSQARRQRALAPDTHTLYVVDEVHAIASHPIGERFLLHTLKEGRKQNAWLWLASNSATDFTKMAGRNDLLMSCATRIYFGDPAATDEQTQGHYADLQLPANGIEQLPYLRDREFLLHAPGAGTLQRLDLRLDDETLAITGTSRGGVDVDAFMARYPVDHFGDRWKVELLRFKGAHAAAARLESLLTQEAYA
jgi:type IV secretory pathway VirB4 component